MSGEARGSLALTGTSAGERGNAREALGEGSRAGAAGRMKESCRICGRELCGNQRRWIFHTAAKLSLQVLLSHVLGKEISRDGKAEFACSKCAFMLERIYRFDTVIARIEALSIERLQKLLLEKDRLKSCIASMYRKNNEDVGDDVVEVSSLPDVRYTAMLQEDFAYSGFECWTELEDRVVEPHTCHAVEGMGNRPRRCRGCAVLRVADADYEAICKIPRKVARSISCGQSSRCSASICNEESPVCEPVTADLPSSKEPLDGESMEETTPGSSLESLDTTVAASPLLQKDEETDTEVKKGGKCDYCVGERILHNLPLHRNRLDIALSLVKAFDCKPVQSPRGSKLPIPVRSSPLCQDLMDKSTYPGFLNLTVKSPSGSALAFPLEMSDLQELWEDLCVDYIPLQVKDLCKNQQQLTQCDSSPSEQTTELNNAELLEKISHFSATNKQLQEKLNEVSFELKTVQHASRKQDHKIQNLNESLKSKESESEELYHVIEKQNETIAKLREMLQRSQLGQMQISEGSSSFQQKQQIALLDMQNTLFFTQLEVQQLKRTRQQKDRQLAEARRTAQFLETVLQEEQHQKEEAWKHNRELRATLQQLQVELQNKNWQSCTLEREKFLEMHRQEQKIKHLGHNLAWKEQLLQESKELLQYHQNVDKNPISADHMVQKLQQRIKDRDAALERAVDEKFCLLEEREQEMQQLRLSVRDRECDLEGLRRVLFSNEATIQGLESLLKARGLELEQLSATCQNLQWLKEEMEAKSHHWQSEQEGIIQQLQTALHDRNKEVEALSATLLCKLGPGQRDIVEEMCLRLQQKEQIIQELLSDKSQQTVQQEAELQELLQTMSTREQQSRISSEKMAQALIERSCELQVLRQQLVGQTPRQETEASKTQLLQKDQSEALKQGISGESTTAMISKEEDSKSKVEKGILETTVGLEDQLIHAKEELELLMRKEQESRLELSALQSVVASQEEELQVQASDVESLTRSIQIKEELIKDLQMQLVDPEEMPAMERLTQEVLILQEKVARVESQGQEATGSRKLQLLLVLERLAAEKNQLNEALQAEKQLYDTLVKFHTHPDSSGQEQTLQVELERIQAIRGQLEEALERSLERLTRLDSLDSIGGPTVTEDAEDASTEFTDSIEEEAQRVAEQQSIKGGPDDSLVGHSSCPAPASLAQEIILQEELLSAKSEVQQVLEKKKKLEEELHNLKGQIEEAGFSSVSHIRKALLSLCLENAELKEQIGEATLSEGWENEDEKEEEEDLRLEVRKLREKLHTSEILIGLLKEQLTLNNPGGEDICKPQLTASMAQMIEQLRMAKQGTSQGILHNDVPQWHCPQLQSEDFSPSHTPAGTQVGGGGFWQQFTVPGQQLHSELPQCRQQCHKLRNKLLVSEATIQAQTAQLEQYRTLLSEPVVQQDSKQIQVDLQDLGYETCGRSENEADREEATSPECEEHDGFMKDSKLWKKLLGSHPSRLMTYKALMDCSQCDDAALLRQHIQDLKVQLQSSHRTIQNLQSCVHSMSTTSDLGGKDSLKLKESYTMGSSPSHSATDEDEGWHSDSFGYFCPSSLQPNKDLARLIKRVSLLEAHLGKAKPKVSLPKELKPIVSMGKYDSLVQAQARELSHLRQMMRDGQGVCHMLSQHFSDTIKSFEELLRGTDIDYFLGQSFREQLAQGNQLAGRLARKLNSKNDLNTEDKSGQELITLRLSKELQEKEQIIKSLQAKLHTRSVTPSSSHTISESSRSGSSTSFLSDGLEGCSDMDDVSDSICYQENLSDGQSHDLLDTDLGSCSGKTSAQPSHPSHATIAHSAPSESMQRHLILPPPQHPSQTASQPSGGVSLPALSSAKPESLASPFSAGSPAFSSKHCLQACHYVPESFPLHNSATWNRKPRETMGKNRPSWNMPHFRQPQEGLTCGSLPSCSSANISSQQLSGADLLEEHLSEIRILRQRLEESICTNDRLREQLETRLASVSKSNGSSSNISAQGLEAASQLPSKSQALQEDNKSLQLQFQLSRLAADLKEALHVSHSKLRDGEVELEEQRAKQQRLQEEIWGKQQDLVQLQEKCLTLQKNNSRLQQRVLSLQQQCEENQLLFQAVQSELCVYEALCGPQQKATSGAYPEDFLLLANDGNKLGAHVIGHLKDWSTLRQQILEGKTLIHKMESNMQADLELQGSKVFHQGSIRQLLANTSSLHRILEKSAFLLAMFWRTTFPVPHLSAQVQQTEQAMQEEIQELRARVAEQESYLQSASQTKEKMENFILTHLTRTYDVLRKARTNLQGMSSSLHPSCDHVLA
ncbi:myomegalin-like isoform X4 [Hemicordylus capensis]|uniref:myomegalin-like isoform X4 n=1 Tax=Hemicordylus capensis TaxID=884348 RepID=UPI00230352A0|nr:myomegalin-like isoform X4 [Hemicordylus capensis]